MAATTGKSQIRTHLATFWAYQPTFILTVEEINDDRVVTSFVLVPTFLGNLVLWPTSVVRHLDIRFLQNSVEVLVQTIE